MLGIKDYNPKFYTELSQILNDHKTRLQGLKGKRIEEIWVAWEQEEDEWFKDLPVVIKFEDCQIELCAYKTDNYAITFDQINLSDEIDYYGTDLVLRWEKNKLKDLNNFINERIVKVEIIEWISQLTGMGFHLEEGYFAVRNGFDENEICTDRNEEPQYKYTYV
ncbi:hypothetical protein [Mesobacillus jeotgali]|uniref:hypothetical protein n=1 Tax=Mesobacillus jeotgali TaxID=129985 RepID=UPI0017809DE9|nr:hypothetical protein [Mesobacillus jeotgali]UYZ21172.1 hypothetical protein FOF60_19330 [Mesobacillus jeotgali]